MSDCIWWYAMRLHVSRTLKSTLSAGSLGGWRLTPAEEVEAKVLWLPLSRTQVALPAPPLYLPTASSLRTAHHFATNHLQDF